MKFFCLIFLVLFGFQADDLPLERPKALHEFHISKCIVEYSAEDEALQIMLHIFIDDLEDALRNQAIDKLFLCTEKEAKNAEQHLYTYLQQNLLFEVNKKMMPYNFIGKEASEDLQAVWCYLEIPNIKSVNQLLISNDLLMEVFDDQKNIINIRLSNSKKGYFLFEKGKSSKAVEF